MLKPHEHDAEITAELKRILARPSLYQEAIALLGRGGFDVGARTRRPRGHACRERSRAAGLGDVYRDPDEILAAL